MGWMRFIIRQAVEAIGSSNRINCVGSDRHPAADWTSLLLCEPRVDARHAILMSALECLELYIRREALNADQALSCFTLALPPVLAANRVNLLLTVASADMSRILLHLQDLIVRHIIDVGIRRIVVDLIHHFRFFDRGPE